MINDLYKDILSEAGFDLSSQALEKRYIDDVTFLLSGGNIDGQGGSLQYKKLSLIAPLPRDGGPKIKNEFFFHFNPDEFALDSIATLKDKNLSQNWYETFVKSHQVLVKSLNLPGKTPFQAIPPHLFDSISALELPQFPHDITILSTALGVTPDLIIPSLNARGIIQTDGLKYTTPVIDQAPYESGGYENNLLKLMIQMYELPNFLILKFLEEISNPVPDKLISFVNPENLIKFLINLLSEKMPFSTMSFMDKLFDDFFQIPFLPKTLICSVLVLIKDIIAAICVVMIGSIIGSGKITKSAAQFVGLI
jgi:hypothetical protein